MGKSVSSSSRRSGFTLIEVAIALALFVIGALAIVRIFPPALSVIRNNENRNTAVLMGESTLARYRNKLSPAPEAVFDVDVSGNWTNALANWQDYAAAVVNSSSKSTTLPKEPTDAAYNASALGHFRYIYGEPHYIGAGQTILLNRPRASQTATGVDIPATAFYDEIVEGVQISKDGYLDFSNATFVSSGNSFSDSANPSRPPDNYRRDDNVTYYISYNWRECTNVGCTTFGPNQGVIEEPISIPENSGWNSTSARVLPSTVNSANQVIPGGVRVRARVNFVPTVVSAGNTAYTTVSVSASAARIYYLNYLSSDWRTLTEDSAPSKKAGAATTGRINLPINGLDDAFNVTGYLTRSDQKTAAAPITPSNVNYKTGEVEYPITDWNGPRIRTIYHTLDNWAHQISVAPRSYYPYSSNRGTVDFPTEPWREYSWNSTDNGTIYFHPGEAGKTVSVTFMNGTTKVTTVGTIDEDLIDKPASVATGFIGPGNTNSKVARLFITDASGSQVTASSILSIQGLSIRARTAWLNNDRYNQVIVPGYRTMNTSGS